MARFRRVNRGQLLARMNRIYGLLLIVSGVVFVVISEGVASGLPFFLLALILMHASMMLYRSKKTRKHTVKTACAVDAGIGFVLCVLLAVFWKRSVDVVAILMAVRTAGAVVEYVFDIGRNKSEKRAILGRAFLIVIHLALLAELIAVIGKSVPTQVVIYGLLFLVEGIAGVYANLKEAMHGKLIGQVIVKSYAAEILAGLMIAVVGASILLPVCEPAIESFGDGLWYSFMLVTTIGFGDMTAVTPAGRLISVAVGIYGIVAVALITSILVNLYNENKEKGEPRRSGGEKPDAGKSDAGKPDAEKPDAEKPATVKSDAGKPSSEKRDTAKRTADKQGTDKQGTDKQGAGKRATEKRSTGKQSTDKRVADKHK